MGNRFGNEFALTNQGGCVGIGSEPSQCDQIQMTLQTHTSFFKTSKPQKVIFKVSSYFMVLWKWAIWILTSNLNH